MSLIFEALKKLDREKQAPERGFLVVGASGWGAGPRMRPLPIVLALAGAGVAGFLFAQWASRPKAEAPRVAAAPHVPPATLAPRTVPPPTYAAPPSTADTAPSAPVTSRAAAPPRTAAPEAAPLAAAPSRVAAAPTAVPAPAVPPTTYTLQAVTAQDGQPVAIVNGQLVRVGDVVEGARVLRIEAETVELEKDGRRIVIGF